MATYNVKISSKVRNVGKCTSSCSKSCEIKKNTVEVFTKDKKKKNVCSYHAIASHFLNTYKDEYNIFSTSLTLQGNRTVTTSLFQVSFSVWHFNRIILQVIWHFLRPLSFRSTFDCADGLTLKSQSIWAAFEGGV